MTVLDDLVIFAQSHPRVSSIRYGCEPEEGTPCWYVMVKNLRGEELGSAVFSLFVPVAELVRTLGRTYGYVNILAWPEIDDLKNKEGFLGELKWQRT